MEIYYELAEALIGAGLIMFFANLYKVVGGENRDRQDEEGRKD